jgi:chemotaxis protein CheC
MLGRSVDIDVPSVLVLPMVDAVDHVGSPEQAATGIVLGIVGDFQASVLLLLSPSDADLMCGLLGVEAGTEIGLSALMEIGNIVGSSYINALACMTGLDAEPTPPATATDMLAAIVESVLAERSATSDLALLLDSNLVVEGAGCSMSFLLVPDHGGVELLLSRLGL